MTWKPIDDAVFGAGQSWPAFGTERLTQNVLGVVAERQAEGNWSSNQIIDRNDDQPPMRVHRRVRIGSHPQRPCGQWWQWGPSENITTVFAAAFVQNETNADVHLQWFILAENGLVAVGSPQTIVANSVLTTLTWTLPLAPVQEGSNRPLVVWFWLEAISDTSTDEDDLVIYDLYGTGNSRDYRTGSPLRVRYGNTWVQTNTDHFQQIGLYEITDVQQQDKADGKSPAWDQHYAYGDRPFIVHLRHDESVVWWPDMNPFPYFANTNSLRLQRMGELTILAMQMRDGIGILKGPMGSNQALVRSLAGGQPGRGTEHTQIWRGQDEMVYEVTTLHSWGPQIVPKDDYHQPLPPLYWTAPGAVTAMAFYAPLADLDATIGQWRIDEDTTFDGDVAASERRAIEILPMWLLMGRLPDMEKKDVSITLEFISPTGFVFDKDQRVIEMQPYWSDFVGGTYFGAGRWGTLRSIVRTFFSNSAMFLKSDALGVWTAMFTTPLYKIPTEDPVARWVRLLVRSAEILGFGESDNFLFFDLGTTIRGAPAGLRNGRMIQQTLGDL